MYFQLRQPDTYPRNISVSVNSSNLDLMSPYIEESLELEQSEVDHLQFTLMPKQFYKLSIAYNCSTEPMEDLY